MKLNKIALIAALFLGTPAMSGETQGEINIKTTSPNKTKYRMESFTTQHIGTNETRCILSGEIETLKIPVMGSKASTDQPLQLSIQAWDCKLNIRWETLTLPDS